MTMTPTKNQLLITLMGHQTKQQLYCKGTFPGFLRKIFLDSIARESASSLASICHWNMNVGTTIFIICPIYTRIVAHYLLFSRNRH